MVFPWTRPHLTWLAWKMSSTGRQGHLTVRRIRCRRGWARLPHNLECRRCCRPDTHTRLCCRTRGWSWRPSRTAASHGSSQTATAYNRSRWTRAWRVDLQEEEEETRYIIIHTSLPGNLVSVHIAPVWNCQPILSLGNTQPRTKLERGLPWPKRY